MQTLPLPPLKLNSKNFELENTYLRICQCPCHLFTAIVSSLALLYNRYHKTQSLGNLIFSISNMPTFIINMLGFLTLESVHLVLNEHDPPQVWLMWLLVDCLDTFGTMNTELLKSYLTVQSSFLAGPCHTYVQQRGRTAGWTDAWCPHETKVGSKIMPVQESAADSSNILHSLEWLPTLHLCDDACHVVR